MLYVSLVLSALLLLIANWSVARRAKTGTATYGACLAFMVMPLLLMCLFPAVVFQSALLCVATIIWRGKRGGTVSYLALSCGATVIASVMAGVLVVKDQREFARLRARYPFESMEARLPVLPVSHEETPLPAAAEERLSRVEEQVGHFADCYRRWQLQLLHERAVHLFVNSPGFGQARMMLPSESALRVGLRRAKAPRQPGDRIVSTWSPGALDPLPASEDVSLGEMLERSIIDFVHPQGLGYIKDRQHVAGFESHRFSEVPSEPERWKVQRIELVSLLLRDEPAVYVSTNLPVMAKSHDEPTRPLDRFERYALDALRHGEEIVTTQHAEDVLMLGAIRSGKICITCHGGERGALLGAFSYKLRPEPPPAERQ